MTAAPMLRLVTSTVGPVPVATGGTAPAQTVEAYNAGDGNLSLSVSASTASPWLTAAVGTPRACTTTTASANCIPLQIGLNTATLAAGTYTGTVTITSPGAVDAPQTLTVTVRVGGIDVYVAPGTTRDLFMTSAHQVTPRATTQSGGPWLTLTLDGTASFRFVYPYRVRIAPDANLGQGVYNGTLTTTGSTVATENVTVPVTMRVTTQPIAQAAPEALNIRLAEGAPPLVYPFSSYVTLNNLGRGTLSITGVTTTGGTWIKQDAVPQFIAFDGTGLAQGSYTGSVTVASNAVNGPTTIPVRLEIVPKGPPLIYFQGVLDNGTFVPGDTVAQGDVMVVKGEQLSFSPFTPGPAPPLATTLGGATVLVNGTAAPLFYSSYGQLAFQMPVNTPVGTALVQVRRDDGTTSNTVSVSVAPRAPRLLAVVNQDGSVNLPDASHPAKSGDVLTIYAIGLGDTSPAVASGVPAPSAEPLARVNAQLLVNFGGSVTGPFVAPAFAGLTPTYAGLYQINVIVPDDLPPGILDLSVGFPDARSNSLRIAIQ